MAKIFTKLNIGDTVASSGTRVFKKLANGVPIVEHTGGLYDANDNLVASWNELVYTYGMAENLWEDIPMLGVGADTIGRLTRILDNNELATGTKFVIDDSVNGITSGVFNNCKRLTSVYIPDGVEYLGTSAFRGCSNLQEMVIPNSVWNVEVYAFGDCTSLTSVTIGTGVEVIDMFAFDGCTALKDVYYCGTEEQWNAIDIEDYKNEYLLNATIHYNSQ